MQYYNHLYNFVTLDNKKMCIRDRDIPDSVIAAGNPCKVIRMITNKDKEYWLKQLEEFEADTGEQVKLEQD